VSRDCPACGQSGRLKFRENIDQTKISSFSYSSRKSPELMHYALLECLDCRSLFTETTPEAEALNKSYASASFDSHIESQFAAKTYCKYLNKFNLIRDKRILDIGCGDGTFLELSKNLGAKSVHGVEPSRSAINSASEVKDSIECIPIEEVNYLNEFDLCTCFQTLEHVKNPMATISKMIESVSSNGHIAVVCHNRFAFINRILGPKSPIFDIEHLQMFSAEGLSKLFENSKLSVVVATQIINIYPLGYWLRLAPLPKKLKTRIETIRESKLLQISIPIPVGNRLIIAQKIS
jgi:SAM-dependent methyltransferase